MTTVRDILEMAGGSLAIASASSLYGNAKLTPYAVDKWRTRDDGIPERHWPLIIALAGKKVTPAVLHRANEMRRKTIRDRLSGYAA
jgi:hypothetical protein